VIESRTPLRIVTSIFLLVWRYLLDFYFF